MSYDPTDGTVIGAIDCTGVEINISQCRVVFHPSGAFCNQKSVAGLMCEGECSNILSRVL